VTSECNKCTMNELPFYTFQMAQKTKLGSFCLDPSDIRFRLHPQMLLIDKLTHPSQCNNIRMGDGKSPIWDVFYGNMTEYKMLREIALHLSSSLKSDVCASTLIGEPSLLLHGPVYWNDSSFRYVHKFEI